MTLKHVTATPGGTAQAPMLSVEDDDTSPSDVATAIAAHAALTSGVHGLGIGGAAVNYDIYIDGVTGSDSNTGLTKTDPLATIAGYFNTYGTQLPVGSTVRVHLAGTGGADPWVTPTTEQAYNNDLIVFSAAQLYDNALVFRGPTNMVRTTPTTGPATAALDAVPAQIVDETGAANPAGYRTELLFTGAAPGWTAHDFGPRAQGCFLRVTRAGVKRYFEIPIADNTASSIIVDTLNIVGDLLNTDTVEIVIPGAMVQGATVIGGVRVINLQGACGFPVTALAADQGMTFERLTLRTITTSMKMLSLDRCRLIPGGAGLDDFMISDGGSVAMLNCAAVDNGPSFGRGAAGIAVAATLTSRPDSAANPAVTTPTVGLMARNLVLATRATYETSSVVSCYGGTASGIYVIQGALFWQNADSPYLGGDSAAAYGIRCDNGGQARVRGGGRTTITGATNDIVCEGHALSYGTGAGEFEEAIGYNGNLHNTTITPLGAPAGGMSRIFV